MDIMETFFLGGSRFFSNRCQCATMAFFFKDKRLNFHHAKKELFSFFWRRSGDFESFNLLIFFFLFFKKFRKYDFTDHRTVEWWWYFHPIEKSISILG